MKIGIGRFIHIIHDRARSGQLPEAPWRVDTKAGTLAGPHFYGPAFRVEELLMPSLQTALNGARKASVSSKHMEKAWRNTSRGRSR